MIKHIIFTLHLQSVLYAGTRRRLAAKALLSDWVTSSSPGVNQEADQQQLRHKPLTAV